VPAVTTPAIKHRLTGPEAATICRDLAQLDIPVLATADVFGTVHLWPGRVVTTLEEITALRPFLLTTDAPIAWHKAAA
jgi:hypothetical protein